MATKVSTQPLQRLIKHRSVAPTRFFASASEAPHAPSSSAPTSSTSNPISYPPLATPTFDQAPTPYIAIPAAGLSPKQGTNRLRIFCHEGVASVAHTLAIVKAVEEKVGKVIDVHQRKQTHPTAIRNTIVITLLNPISLRSPFTLSVQSPRLQDQYLSAGPTLSEVEEALLSRPNAGSNVVGKNRSKTAVQTDNTLLVTVEEAPKLANAMNTRLYAGSARSWVRKLEPKEGDSKKRFEEDEAIQTALGGWKGFYGGFDALQEQYKGMWENAREREAERVRLNVEEQTMHDERLRAARSRPVEEVLSDHGASAKSTEPATSESTRDAAEEVEMFVKDPTKRSSNPQAQEAIDRRSARLAEKVREQARRQTLASARAGGNQRRNSQDAVQPVKRGFKVAGDSRSTLHGSDQAGQTKQDGKTGLSSLAHWFLGSNRSQ